MINGSASSEVRMICSARRNPSVPGICTSVRTKLNGSRCSAARRSNNKASSADAAAMGRMCQRDNNSVKMRRFVRLSSTTKTGVPAKITSGEG